MTCDVRNCMLWHDEIETFSFSICKKSYDTWIYQREISTTFETQTGIENKR